MKPNFDAPTQCWDILDTYSSREACQDVLKEIRTAVSTEMKRGDPLNVARGMLARRCIAVADPKAPPAGGLFCLSTSELHEIQRPLSRSGQTKRSESHCTDSRDVEQR
jgi:hypothetical protein